MNSSVSHADPWILGDACNPKMYGGFPKLGVPFWGVPIIRTSILGSILGYPNIGKLPYSYQGPKSIQVDPADLQVWRNTSAGFARLDIQKTKLLPVSRSSSFTSREEVEFTGRHVSSGAFKSA